ncbi:MAG TPA: ATP-binding protein [Azospirillaceae bacterium]|nr:ATP-binding protein [Azospirillaceae bacterium]
MASTADVFVSLAQNLTLLLALAFLYAFISRSLERHGLSRSIAVGVLFGAISIASMFRPVMLEPGVILDARTIMLSLAASFGGGVAALIAAVMVGAWRLWLGLQAMDQGMRWAFEGLQAGLFGITASVVIGYAAHRIQQRRGRPFGPAEFLGLGIAGTLPPILAAFFIPEMSWSLLERAALPLVLTIPAGTCFLALLLRAQNRLFEDQEALRRSEAQYRLLAETATDVISRHAPDGRWLYASPAIAAVIGHAPEEVVGRHPREFLHPEEAEAWRPGPETHGATVTVVRRWRHRDGRYVWCETVARRAPGSDEVTALTRDISERKARELDLEAGRARLAAQAEELRRSRDEAEAANRAKSRFLAAASHDLRQPFQAMRLFHALLEGDLTPDRRAEAVARLGEALAAGEDLLRALLDVSTLEAGQVKPELATVSIRAVLEAELAHARPLAAAKGLRLRLGPCGGAVLTDPVLLKRMLRNLLVNAIRYTERGGILVGCRRRGDRCRIEVWDTGIGIAAADQGRVFDEFYQVGNQQRDRRLGLGLGLSVVRRTAELLGHGLELRSVPGRGSVFALSAPLAPPVEAAPPPSEPPCPPAVGRTQPPRVLLVEDDAVQLLGLRLTFESWGYRVDAAETAEAALALLERAGAPDLLVSDYRLPGEMNGLRLVAAVRCLLGGALPAVIVTGDTDPARLVEFAEAGCRLVHKPYDAAVLRRVAAELLGIEAPPVRKGARPVPAATAVAAARTADRLAFRSSLG